MITYVKEIVLHHCLSCGRLTESTKCPSCHSYIGDKIVSFKAEINLSATSLEGSVEPIFVNEETLELLFNPAIRDFPTEGFKVRK